MPPFLVQSSVLFGTALPLSFLAGSVARHSAFVFIGPILPWTVSGEKVFGLYVLRGKLRSVALSGAGWPHGR